VKTLDDYMNDPAVAHLQMPLREVKAIRLMIYDEQKDMTPAERVAHTNRSIEEAQEKYGFKFKVAAYAK
jgi:hypothetical protein